MKIFKAVFLIPGLICLFSGCVSSSKAALMADREPVALVSVTSNYDINWKDEESLDPKVPGLLVGSALKKDPALTFVTNSNELINTAEGILRSVLADFDVINLAENERVLHSRAYREARISSYQTRQKKAAPANFRLVDYRDRNFAAALASETGIRRSMYVEFDFTKVMRSGFGKNGKLQACVEMLVIILDEKGKTLYRKDFTAWSSDTAEVSQATYYEADLLRLFDASIEEISVDFISQFGN